MALEFTAPTTLQSSSSRAPAIFCQGRMLTSAELLGVQGAPVQSRSAIALLITAWVALGLAITNPLFGLVTLFAAPLLFPRRAAH